MSRELLRALVLIAGCLHFCQLPAMLLFRNRVLRLGPEIDRLAPITRRIVQVLAVAVVLTVQGLGCIVVCARDELTNRSVLATGLLTFLVLFWGFRALCQLNYKKSWPCSTGARMAHVGLLVIFLCQTGLYFVVVVGRGFVVAGEP